MRGASASLRNVVTTHPWLISTPLLGALLAVLTWPGGPSTPHFGLDPSWQLGIELATERGLDFGREIIWTHGPLGFLQAPLLADGTLWMFGTAYAWALHMAICISFVWVARRSTLGLVLLPVTAIALLGHLVEVSVVLTLFCCVAALGRDAPRFAKPVVLYLGPFFAALEILGKANRGGTILALLAVCLLAIDKRRRNLPIFAGIFAATFAVFWAITAQDFGTVGDYLTNQLQIVSGFGEAHAIEDVTVDWERRVAPLVVLAMLVLAFRASAKDGQLQRWGTIGLAAVFSYTTFKQGFVRHDAAHGVVFFTSFLCGIYALLWRVRPDAINAGAAVLVATAALASLPAHTIDANPVHHLRSLREQVHAFLSPARRDALLEKAREDLQATYAVDPATLRLIGDRPVHIDPWEVGVAWAYGLNWRPLPVFQDQQAYTEELQNANLEALESPSGPEVILRQNTAVVDPTFPNGAIDGDLGAFDPPRTTIAMLCNFEAIRTTERWQLLARRPDRCGAERRIESVHTRFGESVAVPRAGPRDLVVARIHGAEIGGLERLRSLLYRPYGRVIVIDGVLHGLNPGTAASGLLLNAPPRSDYPAPFALGPQAEELSVSSLSGASSALTIDFTAIPISGPGSRQADGGR
jgi:hypothetical protein